VISNLIAAAASLVAVWAVVRYVILIEIRIDENSYKVLYDVCKNNKIILLEEEYTHDKKYPITFSAICFIKDCPTFYLNHQERLMNAGFNAKDFVTKITLLRYNYKKLKQILNDSHKKITNVSVDLLLPYGSDKIGYIKNNNISPIILNDLCYSFEKEVQDKIKTSALLYGNPGNGKTYFIKYLATKYNLPIKIITLSPDLNNHDLLMLFSQIPNDCIVLFEDFDNYFDKRKCIIGEDNKNIKFTFDIILNAFDGVYNTYENVVFIMTVNDIDKVDSALKNRPSRFKYVIEFPNPNIDFINKLIVDDQKALKLLGRNLDQILTVNQYLKTNCDFDDAINKIN
jgi:hypothetical protein